jgi:hypothetical protein
VKSDSFQLNLLGGGGGGGGGGDVIDIVAVSSWALVTACVLRVSPITPPLYL